MSMAQSGCWYVVLYRRRVKVPWPIGRVAWPRLVHVLVMPVVPMYFRLSRVVNHGDAVMKAPGTG